MINKEQSREKRQKRRRKSHDLSSWIINAMVLLVFSVNSYCVIPAIQNVYPEMNLFAVVGFAILTTSLAFGSLFYEKDWNKPYLGAFALSLDSLEALSGTAIFPEEIRFYIQHVTVSLTPTVSMLIIVFIFLNRKSSE